MVLLAERAGVRLQHLPYRGGGPAVNDAVAGHVDLVIGSAALLAPQVAGGTLRPLLQLGPERLPALAQVPTAEESGFPGLQAEAWWGVFAPGPHPDPDHRALSRGAGGALPGGARRAAARRDAAGAAGALRPRGTRPLPGQQVETWGRVVRENNIQAD